MSKVNVELTKEDLLLITSAINCLYAEWDLDEDEKEIAVKFDELMESMDKNYSPLPRW
ncbi:hypothetical protein [Alteribacter populi]|uniref:hypothetical protein n=1 Tax=Alteribacter populi TaxID=2011011 RepID=UPI0012FFC50B|nr:hypothetical protein [Alteribacter populi]